MLALAALRCARRSGRLAVACHVQAGRLQVPACQPVSLPISRHKSTQKKKGGKKTHIEKTSDLDQILEELDDDDIEGGPSVAHVDVPDTPAAAFITQGGGPPSQKAKGKSKGKPTGSSNAEYPDYHDVKKIVNVESYWTQLESIVDNQKKFFQHHINVRSTNALDDLLIDLEGDLHPLKEVASINKKDPKRLVVDMSTFPQAAVSAMDALRSTSLNLNPQQDGLKIYVSLPKVTREHRENVAKAARTRLAETKAEIRTLQNKYTTIVGDRSADKSVSVSKDVFDGTRALVMAIAHYFDQKADADFQLKQQDILSVK